MPSCRFEKGLRSTPSAWKTRQGQVTPARSTRDSTLPPDVAIKVISLNELKTQIHRQLLKNQVSSLQLLNHPNILKCYDVHSTTNNTYIITELCGEGNLSEQIKARGRLLQKQCTGILWQLAQAFRQLVIQGIIHRDIKPANILQNKGMWKLADFGFSIKANQKDVLRCNIGTPLYMSPEALRDNIYSHKSDIWAIGIISYEMYYGRPPISARKEKQLLQKIESLQLSFPEPRPSQSFIQIIEGCCKVDVDERITIDRLHYLLQTASAKITESYIEKEESISPPKEFNSVRLCDYKKNVSKEFQVVREVVNLSPLRGPKMIKKRMERNDSTQKLRQNRLQSYLKNAQFDQTKPLPSETQPSWAQPRFQSVSIKDRLKSRSTNNRVKFQPSPIRTSQKAIIPILQKLQAHISQKIIMSKLSYSRFLFKTLRLIEGIPALLQESDQCDEVIFVLFKNISIHIRNLVMALREGINLYSISDWQNFLQSGLVKRYLTLFSKYEQRYTNHFKSQQYIISPTALHQNQTFLEKANQAARRFVNVVRQTIFARFQINTEEVVPLDMQKLIISVDLIVTYFQMNTMILKNFNNHQYFAETSEIEKFAGGSPVHIVWQHLERIEQKLQLLGLID